MTAPVSRHDLYALLDVSRFGACAAAPEGTVVFWNRRAEQILGLSAEQVTGRPVREIIALVNARAPEGTVSDSTVSATALTAIMLGHSDDALTVYLFEDDDESGGEGVSEPRTQAVAAAAADSQAGESDGGRQRGATEILSPRELEVLRFVAAGIRTEKIASDLNISVHTVRNHVRSLRSKLNAKTKLDAVMTAMAKGLL